MLTSAMPIGACSKAPRKRSSASCTIASARRRSVTSRSTAVVKPVLALAPARERGFQRNLLAVGARGRSSRRRCARRPRAAAPDCPAAAPAGRRPPLRPAGRRSARRPRSRTRRCPARPPTRSHPRAEAATARKCFSLRRSVLLRVLATDQRAHLGGHRGYERNQALVLLALLGTRRTRSPPRPRPPPSRARRRPPASPTACANRPRSNPGSERTSRIQTAPALSHALPGRPIPGTNDSASVTRRNEARPPVARVPGRAAHQRATVGAQHPGLADRPAGALADAPQHRLERALGGVCPGDRQRQVVRERKLLLRAAAVGDVAADAVDQLEAGVRPRAELEPAIGAVNRSQPRLEGGHARPR